MFRILDGRSEFYQWDLDRKVVISDPTVTEVHFCNKTSDCSLVVEVYEEGGLHLANVPNILLQDVWPIRVYAYCNEESYTKDSIIYEVFPRTRPDDYVYVETEVRRWEDLEERINTELDGLDEAEAARNAEVEERIAELDAAEEGRDERVDEQIAALVAAEQGRDERTNEKIAELDAAEQGRDEALAEKLAELDASERDRNARMDERLDVLIVEEEAWNKMINQKLHELDEGEAARNQKADANEAIRDSRAAANEVVRNNTVNKKIAEIDAAEANIQAAERERVAAEDERHIAENDRVAAEEARATAEQGRVEEMAQLKADVNAEINASSALREEFIAYRPALDETNKVVSDHEKRITNLEKHNDDYFITTDNKYIPANACPYIQINSIGGKTYKAQDTFIATVTEIYEPDSDDAASYPTKIEFEYIPTMPFMLPLPSEDGIWFFQANSDYFGSVISLDQLEVYINDDTSKVYGSYESLPSDIVISKITGTLQDNSAMLYDIPVGTQFVCTPYFYDWGSTSMPTFEPPNELVDNTTAEIRLHGSNLIDFEAVLAYWGCTYTKDGDMYMIQSLGKGFSSPYVFTDEPDTYILSASEFGCYGYSLGRIEIGYYDGTLFDAATGDYIACDNTTYQPSTPVKRTKVNAIRLNYSSANSSAQNKYMGFSEVRINKGSVDCGYYPYHEPDSNPFPESYRQFITGKSVDSFVDTLDFENEKFITRVKTIKLADLHWQLRGFGTNCWGYGTDDVNDYVTYNAMASLISYELTDFVLDTRNVLLCNVLPSTTDWQGFQIGVNLQKMKNGNHYININVPVHWIGMNPSTDYAPTEKMLQWLRDNDATLTYALQEPIVTDIDTTDFDGVIEVEAGGWIELVNENNIELPLSYTYLAKEGSI